MQDWEQETVDNILPRELTPVSRTSVQLRPALTVTFLVTGLSQSPGAGDRGDQ